MKTAVLKVVKKAKYIRVSSMEQNSSRQRETDKNVKLYEDRISGLIPFNERPSGKKLIKDIQEGKINYVIIHSVDRLGRNVVEMQKQLNWFIENGIQIYAENIRMELLNDDSSMNSIAKMIIDLLGSVAGLEIEAIKERQLQGIKIAKIDQVLGAKNASMRIAGELDVEPGAALLSNLRVSQDESGKVVDILDCLYNPKRFQYAMVLSVD